MNAIDFLKGACAAAEQAVQDAAVALQLATNASAELFKESQKLNNDIRAINSRIAMAKIKQDKNVLLAQLRAAQARLKSYPAKLTAAQLALNSANMRHRVAKDELKRKRGELDAAVAAAAAAPKGVFKRAALIGINYVGTPYTLHGCVNDVTNMERQIRTLFPKAPVSIRILTDEAPVKPSKANIIAAIDWLVADLKPGENVLFHYSGHGGALRDTNGDEADGYDSCIFPCAEGKVEYITDDELRSALAVRVPAGCKCFVILDSCYSGTAVDLRYLWQTGGGPGSVSYMEDKAYLKTDGDVLFLSACRDLEVAMDTVDSSSRPAGALTWALLETWQKYGPAIKTKYLLWDVRQFLKERGYAQVPELSTGRYIDLQAVFDLNA